MGRILQFGAEAVSLPPIETLMKVETIAFYNWRYPYGGGEVVTHNLALFFRGQGMRVLIYTGDLVRGKLTEAESERFEFRELPHGGDFRHSATAEALCDSLCKERVDCIVVQGVNEFPFERVRERTSCRIVFCLHNKPFWEVDFLRRRSSRDIVDPTLARRAEYLLLRRPLYWLTPKLRHRAENGYARILRSVDRFVLLCDAYRRDFERDIRRRFGDEFPAERFAAILNPLQPVEAQPMQPKEKIVLYAGRLVRVHKRVDRLLKIWRRLEDGHPEWRLVIVGDGEERAALERRARTMGLRRVEFAGHSNDMEPYYRRATFVCLTSNFEGLPMSLMEGQQYGCIPVSFDSYAGIRQIACEGRCGIVVPAFDLRGYARRLGAAMEDAALCERMRAACPEAVHRYDPQVVGREWLRLFSEL